MTKYKYVKCPECPNYLGSDPQYGCTLCWGSRIVTLHDYEWYTDEPYYGDDYFDEDGNKPPFNPFDDYT